MNYMSHLTSIRVHFSVHSTLPHILHELYLEWCAHVYLIMWWCVTAFNGAQWKGHSTQQKAVAPRWEYCHQHTGIYFILNTYTKKIAFAYILTEMKKNGKTTCWRFEGYQTHFTWRTSNGFSNGAGANVKVHQFEQSALNFRFILNDDLTKWASARHKHIDGDLFSPIFIIQLINLCVVQQQQQHRQIKIVYKTTNGRMDCGMARHPPGQGDLIMNVIKMEITQTMVKWTDVIGLNE